LFPSIGIDIEDVSRFSCNKFETTRSFYEKIFTKEEIDYCLKKANPYIHFTVRFCAKEATVKALKNKSINYQHIEIKMINNVPILYINQHQQGAVSLSHTDKYAVACVIIND
jgi:holo-[acyl-carrier protein] synthase